MLAGILLAGAVTVAACGGGTGGGQGSGGGVVATSDRGGGGQVLVDGSGRTLYASDQETHGVSCTGDCLTVWMPLTVSPNTPVSSSGHLTGTLSTVTRPDSGARQVTYDGYPLYTFAPDTPGQAGGDNVTDSFGGMSFTWHAMTPSGPGAPQPPPSGGSGGYGGY